MNIKLYKFLGAYVNQVLGRQGQKKSYLEANLSYSASSRPLTYMESPCFKTKKEQNKQKSLNNKNKIISTNFLWIINMKGHDSPKFGINCFEIELYHG